MPCAARRATGSSDETIANKQPGFLEHRDPGKPGILPHPGMENRAGTRVALRLSAARFTPVQQPHRPALLRHPTASAARAA